MKIPTCDCIPMRDCDYLIPIGDIWLKETVIIGNYPVRSVIRGHEVVSAYLELNFCPQCGAPYKESEAQP
jgi:N-dimethylarginine dimethylaminohydrolase